MSWSAAARSGSPLPSSLISVSHRRVGTVGEHLSDDVIRDALATELATKCHGATGTGAVPALHPRSSEVDVVEVADLDESLEDPFDDGRRISQMDQSLARLIDGARTHRQEGGRGLHHRVRLRDRRTTSTPRLSCLAALLR